MTDDVADLIDRAPKYRDHPSYMETFHDMTIKVLSTIDLRLAQGDNDSAHDLVRRLRAKQDAMWETVRLQAEQGVRP